MSSRPQRVDDIDQQILGALASGSWVSGAALSESLGLSRAALAKRMARLNNAGLGLAIDRRHGKGYCLHGGIDLLQAADGHVHPALGHLPGLCVLRSCASTNDHLLANPGIRVVLAEHQTAGRGRRGRRWHAPYGHNLLLSLRHRYAHWPTHLPALSLVLGLAVVDVLRRQGVAATIKWPNDIWLEGRKIAGILIDSRGEIGAGCELIIGLGLNVHMRPTDDVDTGVPASPAQASTSPSADADPAICGEIDQPWTSLAAAQPHSGWCRAQLAAEVIAAMDAALAAFGAGVPDDLVSTFAAHDALAGCAVQLQDGRQVITGHTRGITPEGALRLAADDGSIVHYVAGDLSLRLNSARHPPQSTQSPPA